MTANYVEHEIATFTGSPGAGRRKLKKSPGRAGASFTSGWDFKRPPAVGAKTAGAARSLDPPELRGRANEDRQSP
jgi:hypothetical protein